MMKVSIIILNWNTTKDTIECLESLKNQNYKDYEIILVDNNSRIEEYERLKAYVKKNILPIKLFRTKSNLGFTGGCNFAIKNANGKYFCFLNNDTIVDKNFLSELVEPFKHDDKIGATVGKLLFHRNGKKTNIIQYAGGKLTFYGMSVSTFIGKKDGPECNNAGEQGSMTGTFVVSRDAIKKLKELFCEFYFFYFEEADLAWRLRSNNYKVVYVPSSITYHKGSASIKANKKLSIQDIFSIRNKYLTFFRNLRPLDFLVVFPIMFVYDLGRVVKHFVKGNPIFFVNFIIGFTKFLTSTGKIRKPRMGNLSELSW